MNIKGDQLLEHLRNFGFRLEEKTSEGFLRYAKVIGNLIVTICNGQFENKIRISMLQDKDGKIRTTYHDVLAYADLIGALYEAGMIGSKDLTTFFEYVPQDYDMNENPLMSFPKKPEGFMAQ